MGLFFCVAFAKDSGKATSFKENERFYKKVPKSILFYE